MSKVVLAYSGGLDTSIIIPWLKENYDNCEVIAVCGDVGQGDELNVVREKALASGASKVYIEDLKEEFVSDYVFPMIRSGALYEGGYLLGTSCARPLISKALVEVAKKEGADYIAHGATGKGNDQVRFELTIKALSPATKIIAPWRIWDIKSREDAVDFANAHNVPVPVSKKRPYSMDRNVLHLSHEGADLEDPANEPLDDLYLICNRPEDAPDEAEYITLTFEKGNAVKLNGEALAPLAMLEKLNGVIALETLDSYDSLSDYGFDKPQNTITVTVGDKTTTFYIGDYNDMVSEYYLKMEGDDAVYLVDSTLKDTFSKTADSLVKEEDTETEEATE